MNDSEIKTALADHAEWLKDCSKGKRANLSGADLSGADLSRADLPRANLSGANLSRANLSGADLSRADLPDGVRMISVAGIGSVRRVTTYRIDTDEVWCGCFHGTFKQFRAKVESTYAADTDHGKHYRAAIAFFEGCK